MENRDFIDRKVVGVEKLFSLAIKDTKALVLVISLGVNIYLGHKVIKTNEEMREEIIKEVRRQVPTEVRRETSEQLTGVSSKVDTVLNKTKEFMGVLKELGDE